MRKPERNSWHLQYRQIYKIVVDLLDKLVDLLGEEYFPSGIMQMFWKKVCVGKVGAIPPEQTV